jgi:hypothetical protein
VKSECNTGSSTIADHRAVRADGDATFQQVEIDMFRMAALFVVERLKPWLMTYLAALLATAAPAPFNIKFPARCATIPSSGSTRKTKNTQGRV